MERSFGRRIQIARVDMGKSLRQVATDLGMSAMYLSELETGKKMPDRSKVVPKLAEYYVIDINELWNLLDIDIKAKAREALLGKDYKTAFAAARKRPDLLGDFAKMLQKGGTFELD